MVQCTYTVLVLHVVFGGVGGPLINIPSGPILSLSTVVRIVTGPKMLDLS